MKKLLIFITLIVLCFTCVSCELPKDNNPSSGSNPPQSNDGNTVKPNDGTNINPAPDCSHVWTMKGEITATCGEEIEATYTCEKCFTSKTEKVIVSHEYNEQRACIKCNNTEWEIAKANMQTQSFLGENTNYKYTLSPLVEAPSGLNYINFQEKNGAFRLELDDSNEHGVQILFKIGSQYIRYLKQEEHDNPSSLKESFQAIADSFLPFAENQYALISWVNESSLIEYDSETKTYSATRNDFGYPIQVTIENGMWKLINFEQDGYPGLITIEYGTADFELPENIPSN